MLKEQLFRGDLWPVWCLSEGAGGGDTHTHRSGALLKVWNFSHWPAAQSIFIFYKAHACAVFNLYLFVEDGHLDWMLLFTLLKYFSFKHPAAFLKDKVISD